MTRLRIPLIVPLAAMTAVVVLSNFLVQFPINDVLTWGAITYPFSFLITDLTRLTSGRAVSSGWGLRWPCCFRSGLPSAHRIAAPARHPRRSVSALLQRWPLLGWPSASARSRSPLPAEAWPSLLAAGSAVLALARPGALARPAVPGSALTPDAAAQTRFLARLEQRLGTVHARQRLGIEADHEAQCFGQGLNFFHIENWYSVAFGDPKRTAAQRPLRPGRRNAGQRPGAPEHVGSPRLPRRVPRLHDPASQRPARRHELRGDGPRWPSCCRACATTSAC